MNNDLMKMAYLRLNNHSNAHDVLQETMIIAYQSIHKLRVAKYFKTWIIKILINECYRINKLDKKYANVNDEFIDNIKDKNVSTKRNLEEDSFLQILNMIDEKYHIIIFLYYAEEMKIKEIAKTLELNTNIVKTRLKRGKELLKSIYEVEEY